MSVVTAPRVATAVLAVAALLFLVAGGAALRGDAQKDGSGYFATGLHRFATDRSAIATEALDIDAGATVRIQARSSTGKPLFLGIARPRDVDAYLSGIDHSRVTDVDYPPFHADYVDHPAAGRPAAPSRQRFWAQASEGRGLRTLTWYPRGGTWSVVVMNADGSPRVAADVGVGANVAILRVLGWIAIGLGGLLAVAATGVVVRGAVRRAGA